MSCRTIAADSLRTARRATRRARRRRPAWWILGQALAIVSFAAVALPAETPLRPIPAALHVHSTWSTGALSLDELARLASARGIEVVFLAENHLQRYEYGLPPLRGVLRYRVESPSVLSNSPEAFLRDVEATNARHPDVLFVPGVEIVPHYYWTGSLVNGTLTMHDAQKNLLALGLYRPEDYRTLPAAGNVGAAPWSVWSLWLLSPVLLAIPGIWLLRTTRRRVVRLRYVRVTAEHRRTAPGVLCLLAGLLLLVNNYPFRRAPFSAYDSHAGLAPYQGVIDFVAARRGLAVWSLPEARDHQVVTALGLRATIRTDPYPADLLRTDRFAAFGGVYEDTTTFTGPGQGWDQLLLAYLDGRRAAPAWAVGEAAFHSDGEAGKRLGTVQTVVLAARKDASSVLEALRAGRAYCRLRTNDENLALDRFQVRSSDAEPVAAGGRLALRPGDRPEVFAVIESATGRRLPIRVRLIRSGSVVQMLRAETPVTVRWTEPPLVSNARLYYRLEASGPVGLRLLSNPIFVEASRERIQ